MNWLQLLIRQSFCQMMKDMPGSVVLDICQPLCPSKLKIKHFQVFPCTSQQWPRQHKCERHPTWFIRKEADVGKSMRERAMRSCPCCFFLPLQWHCSDPHCFLPGLFQQSLNWSPTAGLTSLPPSIPWTVRAFSIILWSNSFLFVILQWLPHAWGMMSALQHAVRGSP